MRTYTVADTEGNIIRGNGVEIMASSFEEARDKAESLGVNAAKHVTDGVASLVYSISDGSEIRSMECDCDTDYNDRSELGEEGPELL